MDGKGDGTVSDCNADYIEKRDEWRCAENE